MFKPLSSKLIFAVALLVIGFFMFAPAGKVSALDYADVKSDGWTFWVDAPQTDINSSNFTRIIANKDEAGQDQYAVFEYEKTTSGKKIFQQMPDYYAHAGAKDTCAAHIDWDTTNGSGKLWMQKGTCNGSWAGSGISLKPDIPADILEKASLENFGAEPIGCPTFGTLPTGQSYRNYNCPDGKSSVQDGIFKENERITPTADPTAGTGDDLGMTDCESWGNPIAFFVCPVIDGLFAAVRGLDGIITSLMIVDTDQIFTSSSTNAAKNNPDVITSTAYHQAWSSFRTIALGLVVIAALVIVIASAFGLEILDAYTIKKALPRVFIAVIGIALSWQITEFFINLSNDAGTAVRALIYTPFASLDDYKMYFSTQFITVFAFAAALWVYGFVILTFLLTALIGISIALLILIVREMIIIFCVIIAPVAIVCFILPNTQKFWSLWQKTFVTLLIVFPIISGFIALGRVFSMIAYADGTTGTVNNIIAFIAYFLPYFLIPLAFKMAGGVMATISGVGNDRSRGVFDRLSKGRQRAASKNMKKTQEGRRIEARGSKDGNLWQRGLYKATTRTNSASIAASTGYDGRFGFGERGKAAIESRRRIAKSEMQKTPEAIAMSQDDDALTAQTYETEAAAKEALNTRWAGNQARINRAIAAAKINGGFGRVQSRQAALARIDTGTGYGDVRDANGNLIMSGIDDLTDTLHRVSGGDVRTEADLVGYSNAITKQRGRNDLAPGYQNLLNAVHGYTPGTTARTQVITDGTGRTLAEAAFDSAGLYQLGTGKPAQLGDATAEMITGLIGSTNTEEIQRGAIKLMELQATLAGGATGDNQRAIHKILEQNGIDYNQDPTNIDQQISALAKARAGVPPPGTIGPLTAAQQAAADRLNASTLRARARVYDAQDPTLRQQTI